MKILSVVAAIALFISWSGLCAEEDAPYSKEAARIAVDKKFTLHPDVELAQKITRELEVLRTAYPCFSEYRYRGELIGSSVFGSLNASAIATYERNPDAFIAPLKAEFGEVEVKLSEWGPYITFDFEDVYNVQLLAMEVQAIIEEQLEVGPKVIVGYSSSISSYSMNRLWPVITIIEPNFVFGDGGGLDYDYESETYTITIAGGDCPAGCTYKRTWHFKVIGDRAVFVKVTGSALPTIGIGESMVSASVIKLNAGASVRLDNNHPGCLLAYEWYKDGARIAEESNGNLIIETVSYDDAGEYYCETVDTFTGERVRGRSFILDVKPENYLWRRDEFSTGFSLDYHWATLIGDYHPFGYVDARHDPVVYIHGYGWVYAFGTYDGPVWLYDTSMGWCYTAVGLFPFLYSYDNAEWEYFEKGFWTGTHRLIYGFESQTWRFVPISEIEGFPRLVYE